MRARKVSIIAFDKDKAEIGTYEVVEYLQYRNPLSVQFSIVASENTSALEKMRFFEWKEEFPAGFGSAKTTMDCRVLGLTMRPYINYLGHGLIEVHATFEQRRKWSCHLPLIKITKPITEEREDWGFLHNVVIEGKEETYGGTTVVFEAYTLEAARRKLYKHLFAFSEDEDDGIVRPPIKIAEVLYEGAVIINK